MRFFKRKTADISNGDVEMSGDANIATVAYHDGPTKQKEAKQNGGPVDSVVYIADDQLEFEQLEIDKNQCTAVVQTAQNGFELFWKDYGNYFIWIFLACLAALYFIYFVFVMIHEFGSEKSVRLLWITLFTVFVLLVKFLNTVFGGSFKSRFGKEIEAIHMFFDHHGQIISWLAMVACFIGVLVFTFVDAFLITDNPYNLVSLLGILVFVLLFYISSNSPMHVNWRSVGWGVVLQLLLALFILRWDVGYDIFKWIGNRVTYFLDNASAGSAFLFGAAYREHYFAFGVLPKIVFFSSVIACLHYIGIIQWVVVWIGWVIQSLMATTAGESINAAGNIFFGQSECSFMIKPFVGKMTKSELHAVLTSGFATISGSLMAGYIAVGADAHHLIAASVMSAPASLALSKLRYPEREVSKTTAADLAKLPKSDRRNIIDAASSGAMHAVKLVAYISVNIIAFVSLLHFLNNTLMWLGERVDLEKHSHEPLTFQLIFSYLLYPFAFFMGVKTDDCRKVAELIGIKIFTTPFIAYKELGVLMANKVQFQHYKTLENGTWERNQTGILLHSIPGFYNETFLDGGTISDRSEVISQYALCGLSDIGVMGIMLGILGGMAPHRMRDLSQLVFSGLLAGNVACFMTGCVAGLYYQEE